MNEVKLINPCYSRTSLMYALKGDTKFLKLKLHSMHTYILQQRIKRNIKPLIVSREVFADCSFKHWLRPPRLLGPSPVVWFHWFRSLKYTKLLMGKHNLQLYIMRCHQTQDGNTTFKKCVDKDKCKRVHFYHFCYDKINTLFCTYAFMR